jgi:hypothetical protein
MVGLLAPSGGRDLGRSRRATRDPAGARRTARPDRGPPTRPPPTARHRLAGGRVLLVDDLATTGGTLAGAAATLRHAGARHVEAAVLATAPTAVGVAPASRVAPGSRAAPGSRVAPDPRAPPLPDPRRVAPGWRRGLLAGLS